jgi:hypothetical protein
MAIHWVAVVIDRGPTTTFLELAARGYVSAVRGRGPEIVLEFDPTAEETSFVDW